MSEYYDEVPLEYPKYRKISPGTVLIGDWWELRKLDGKYVFEYVSGELAGRAKKFEITESDFQQLESGKMTDYDLMLKYNAS